MTFQPGNPGRPFGAVTKSGLKSTAQVCLEQDFCWELEAIKRFRDVSLPQASRDYALGLLADRLSPKLKAIDVKVDDQRDRSNVMINIVSANQPTSMIEEPATLIPHEVVIDNYAEVTSQALPPCGDDEVMVPGYAAGQWIRKKRSDPSTRRSGLL